MAEDNRSLFSELSRRNVWRVGIAYAISSWLLLQIIDVLSDILELPGWVPKFFLVVLSVGFVLALIFAWVYEMTPEGIKREVDVDRSQSITGETGKRLNLLTMVVLAAAVGFLLIDKYMLDAPQPAVTDAEAPATSADKPSIAVLPFTNMSADPSSGYFSDGLADTLLHMLAQIGDLRVAARTSSFQFRDPTMDIRSIASQLEVSSVLEGSVQKAGNKIRITAQLIDAEGGHHLWSGNFDRELDDVFAIQDEIAREVVDALQVSLLGDEAVRLTKRRTDNVDAYTEYMLGLDAAEQFSFESLPRAEMHFRRAVQIDPEYAAAHAQIGRVAVEMFDTGLITYDEYIERVMPAIERALAIEPDNAAAIILRGVTLAIDGDNTSAETMFRQAIKIAPNEIGPRANLSRLLASTGRAEEALEVVKEALRIDPLSLRLQARVARIHNRQGNYPAAREAAALMRQIDPAAPSGYYIAAQIDSTDGNPGSSIAWYLRAMQVDPQDPEIPVEIGDIYLDLGDSEAAEYWYRRGIEIDPTHPLSKTSMMYLYMMQQTNFEDAVAVARAALAANIDDRKGSRSICIDMLFLEGQRSGDFSEFLGWVEESYPAFLPPEPEIPSDSYAAMGSRVAFALIQSKDDTRGKLIAEAMLDQQSRSNNFADQGMSAFHVATLVGDDTVIDETLRKMRSQIHQVGVWDVSDHLHPWLGDYLQHPDYVALKKEREIYVAQTLAEVHATIDRPWMQKNGAPPK